MIITVQTIISFDNAKEQDEIKKFIEDNDTTEWLKYESTLMTSFTTTNTYYRTIGE